MNKTQFWRLQKAANLSNLEIADWFEVDKKTITRWRNGKPEAPKAVIMAIEYRIKYGCL